ncbi:MAG: (2Fe-2S)-binding protein, partial [Rhizobiales bacterium]|nr:(2Fe-2S)-binding protein [Hyphomicrobiales bacterium]
MTLIKETDFGTPEIKSATMVTLEIDGYPVTVPEGTSIMRAAMEIGTKIPKLCATDSLDAFGSCRLCLVEIEGRKGTPASCTTPVAAGTKVRTKTDFLKDFPNFGKRADLEMLLTLDYYELYAVYQDKGDSTKSLEFK